MSLIQQNNMQYTCFPFYCTQKKL